VNEDIRYRQLMRYASESVWAVLPSTLWTIRELLSLKLQGVKLEREEVEARITSGRAKPDPAANGAVAVVPLWGVLVPHAGMMVDVSTPGTGLDAWAEEFKATVADPRVDTVVLQINSPGGSAEGVTETAKIIRDARAKKRIVAVADGMAASAAFALATQADEFYVTPSGMVGAVHCYSIHEDISKALEAEGVTLTLIGEPDNGAAETPPFLPLSEENLAHMQQVVGQFYNMFVADVAKGRGVDASTVEATYGQGRVLTARDALKAGMVDGVASFEDVLAALLSAKPNTAGNGNRSLGAAVAHASDSLISAPMGLMSGGELRLAFGATAKTHAAPQVAAKVVQADGTTTGGSTIMDAVSIDGQPPTTEELAAQQTHLEAEMDDLVANAVGRAFNEDEQNRFDTLEEEHLQIGATIKNINDRATRRAALAADPAKRISGVGIDKDLFNTNAGRRGPTDIFDLAAYRSHARSVEDLAPLWRDGAKRANEIAPYRTKFQDETRMLVQALLDQDESSRTHDSFAHRMLIAANPAYDAAFGRWIMGRDSQADAGLIKMAVSNTGLGSETPVPITIDPTVLYTGDGARSPLRQLSQVVTITGLTWRGIGSDGVTLSYGTETAAITPVDPSFDAPDISVVPARGEIQFTVDVDDDWPTLRSELQRMFSQAKFRLEADKFLNGTGTNEPTGLIFALDDDGASIVDTATANTLALADVIKVNDDLPASFDFNATWLAHKAFYSNVAALAAAEGRIDVWVPLTGGFNQQSGLTGYNLLNSPAATASEISKLFTTGSEEVAVIGDFSQGFVIVDRVGLNVELDLHPRDTNGKWTGNRGLLCWFRNNTALRTPNAFRLLRIKHT
jgi:HK97 family phage major capsid protein